MPDPPEHPDGGDNTPEPTEDEPDTEKPAHPAGDQHAAHNRDNEPPG